MERTMKDSGLSWIKEVPNHWRIMPNKYVMSKLKEIQDIYKGEDIISLSTDGVKVRDLDAGGKMPKTFDGYQRIKPDRLLMCLFDMDVTPRCIGLIKDEGLTSPAYSQFVVNENGFAPYYYYYYLSLDFDKTLVHLAKNLRHSLTEDQLGAINVPVPPVEEQEAIAKYLDDKVLGIDMAIKEAQALIDKYKTYKQSVITETVTKGLGANVSMKDSGVEWIGEIPEHWKAMKASYLFKENVRKPDEDSIPLSLSQKDGLLPTDDMKESSLKTASYDNWKKVLEEDLVLNRFKAHLGVMFAATLSGMVSFHYGVYEKRRPLVTKYYEYLFHTDNYKVIYGIMSNGITVGLQNLSNQNFYNVQCIYPPLEEQLDIVRYLDEKCSQIDAIINEKEALISKLQEYKKSIIFEYVTGKKEVPYA